MKKILLSLGVIVVVGIAVAGATGAFYNDTETSTGNIFTAGSIDLKVVHLKQTYNGADCKTCDVTVVSDPTNTVIEKNSSPLTPYPAVYLTFIHPAWTAQNDPELVAANAKWIWEQDPVKQADTTTNAEYTFQKEFVWWGPVVNTDLYMAVGSDNGVEAYLNGVLIGSNTGEFGYKQESMMHILAATITANIVQGNNVLKFKVTNMGLPNGTPESNPAGLIYKFHISGNCQNDYFKLNCHLWGPKDLVQGDTFFKFNDVKPGDFGTDVISLHVDSNDAFSCMLPIYKQDLENVCNNAETKAGDNTCDTGPDQGELGTQINVVAWDDSVTPDGVHQPGEAILYQGPIKDESFTGSGLAILAGGSKNIGQAWCAGSIPHMGDGDGAVICNASGMDNKAQTDSFQADLELYATQQRNNEAFTCASIPKD